MRERILKEASWFTPEMEDAPFLGFWAIRDLLAHLSGWDISNLEAARDFQEGNVPGFYAHYDRDWVSYNATLVDRYKRGDLPTQLALMRDTHRDLLYCLDTFPAEEMFQDKGLRYKGFKVILSSLLEVERQGEEEHLEQIKRFVGNFQS